MPISWRAVWGACSLVLLTGYAGHADERAQPIRVEEAKAASVPANPSRGMGGARGLFPDEKMRVNARTRSYRLVVPDKIDGQAAVPLLLAYHGLGDSKETMPVYSRLDQLAEQRRFILVYPNASKQRWHIAPEAAREDVAFFDELYDYLTARYNIDRNRVYLTGMSNGAFFINLLASERSDRIAAIGVHSGGIGLVSLKPLQVRHKYAVMIVHGDKDQIVKLETARNTRDVYIREKHPVEYLELTGLGHVWGERVGINEKMWEFFLEHPRR